MRETTLLRVMLLWFLTSIVGLTVAAVIIKLTIWLLGG